MKHSKSEGRLKAASYGLTIAFLAVILFPLFLIASYSMMDANDVDRYPPKLLPSPAKSVRVILDYTGMDASDEALLDLLQRDAAMAMYTTVFECGGDSIGEVVVYGVKDGRTVFRQRAHAMFLRLQLDYDTYRGLTRVDRSTLFVDGKHRLSAQKMKYRFLPEGLDQSVPMVQTTQDALSDKIAALLTDGAKNRGFEGALSGVTTSRNTMLQVENYLYYFLVPVYLFPTVPIIARFSFFAFLFNTLLVMAVAVATQVGLCSITAFGLSRLFSRRMSNALMMFFLITMMIPFICIVLPQLILFKNWGMINTYWAMLLPYCYPSAFFIFLFRGFFDRLPQSLFDAAQIDGASHFFSYLHICMPLSKPIISVVILNVLVSAWGDFFWYMLAANRSDLWTINLALYGITSMSSTKTNISMGLAFMSIVPVILVSLLFSGKIKESIAHAGIKG